MGIARETALYLYSQFFHSKNYLNRNKIEIEDVIRHSIKENYINMPYWIQVQLDFLI